MIGLVSSGLVAESEPGLKSDEDIETMSVDFSFWNWEKGLKEQEQIQRRSYFTLLLFFNNRGYWEIFIGLGRLRKEAKKRWSWLGAFGHRQDPKGRRRWLESRMMGPLSCWGGRRGTSPETVGGFGCKNWLGLGNWCEINGKRFFRKMEAWSFEKCEKNERCGEVWELMKQMKAEPEPMRPEPVWSAWIWSGHGCMMFV